MNKYKFIILFVLLFLHIFCGAKILIIEFSRSHSETQHGRTLLGELLVQRRDLQMATHNTYKRDNHDFDGIRTCNPSKREAANPCFKRRGHQCTYYIQ